MNTKLLITSILGILLMGVILYYNSYNNIDFKKKIFPANDFRIQHVLLKN